MEALGDELHAALADPAVDPRVRTAALGALVRGGTHAGARRAWSVAAVDDDVAVRRRAAELTPRIPDPPVAILLTLLGDAEPLVRDAACFASGEVAWSGHDRAAVVGTLVAAGTDRDPLVREAAVAALGAIGDDAGRATVLAACADRPAVRRRAVLALAAFEGPEVEAALAAALEDPDWQTRQAAEDLTIRSADERGHHRRSGPVCS